MFFELDTMGPDGLRDPAAHCRLGALRFGPVP
jgi:hypothetical protein